MIIIPMGLFVFIAMHTFVFLRTPRNKMLLASSPETEQLPLFGTFPKLLLPPCAEAAVDLSTQYGRGRLDSHHPP